MNALQQKFQEKKEKLLTIYFTAGYPSLNDTGKVLLELQKAGADIVEIGMPFSDPVADGPTIQQSNLQALKNGMNLSLLFEQLKAVKSEINIPVLLMGYLNPIWKFGVEKFMKACSESGVSGLILPDIPLEEYQENYAPLYQKYNLSSVFLVTPQTSNQRIQQLDDACNGFIYLVSSSSTTGANKAVDTEKQQAYFERVKALHLKNPTQIGFNINNKARFDEACAYADGGIVGSAFIKQLSKEGNLEDNISAFVQSFR